MLRLRLRLLLLLLVLLVSGCTTPSQPTLPKLTPHKATHFTISLPEGWAVETASENGDQVVFSNPKEPGAFVAVFTFFIPENVRWPKLEERWQFAGRNPVPFQGDDGRRGIAAEGPRQTDPAKQILAVGYREGESWEMIAEAGAPKEQFESLKPLLTAMLKTLHADPVE